MVVRLGLEVPLGFPVKGADRLTRAVVTEGTRGPCAV